MIAQTPTPPYYAVIFTSIKSAQDEGYAEMAQLMTALAEKEDGYLGIESARNEIGITVSYWRDKESIARWKSNTQHQIAQQLGKTKWYNHYVLRICLVETEYQKNND